MGLDRLAEAGLLFCRGVAPQASYLFKHALVQDAAYGTLLRARRQELQARVAAVLEHHFADLVERQPELLASVAGKRKRGLLSAVHPGRRDAPWQVRRPGGERGLAATRRAITVASGPRVRILRLGLRFIAVPLLGAPLLIS